MHQFQAPAQVKQSECNRAHHKIRSDWTKCILKDRLAIKKLSICCISKSLVQLSFEKANFNTNLVCIVNREQARKSQVPFVCNLGGLHL